MTKLLLIVLAVAVLLWLLFGRRRGGDAPRRQREGAAGSSAESMVACAHCGVHLPRSEALAARGLHYCSGAHRDALPPAG